MKNQNTARRGFTLVELLVVIGVLGVLAAGLLIAINPAQQLAKARDSSRKAAVKQMSNAITQYIASQGKAPINRGPGGYCTTNADFLQELVDTGELKQIPKGPGNTSYCYYDYGANNTIGGIVVTTLESIPDTTVPPEGSCRPFNTANWCSSTVASKYYCMCNPY